MKALYLYSDKTGINKSVKLHSYIERKLSNIYDEVEIVKTESKEQFIFLVQTAYSKYDIVVFAGGDGTFNIVVNAVAPLPENERPLLGYIPTGTINDAGKSFGLTGSVHQALRILKKGKKMKVDIGKANDGYFAYVCAIGRYADIAYDTPRSKKKHVGRVAYYFNAVGQAFVPKEVKTHIVVDGKDYDFVTPFVLILNGPYVGGFPIISRRAAFDGKIDLFLTKPGLFNGLIHYLFFKVKTTHLIGRVIDVSTDQKMAWCFDGEKGTFGDLHIECLPRHLTFVGKPRKSKKNKK